MYRWRRSCGEYAGMPPSLHALFIASRSPWSVCAALAESEVASTLGGAAVNAERVGVHTQRWLSGGLGPEVVRR